MMKQSAELVKLIQEALDNLERKGLVAKTGEFRPGQYGELLPVYALTPLGELHSQLGWLDEPEQDGM